MARWLEADEVKILIPAPPPCVCGARGVRNFVYHPIPGGAVARCKRCNYQRLFYPLLQKWSRTRDPPPPEEGFDADLYGDL